MNDIKIDIKVHGLGADGKGLFGHSHVVPRDEVDEAWGAADLVARAVERAAEAVVAEIRRRGVPQKAR